MPFKIRRVEQLTSADPVVFANTVGLGAPFGVVTGFRLKLWATAAKAANGTDTTGNIKLVDRDGFTFYNGTATLTIDATPTQGIQVPILSDDSIPLAAVMAARDNLGVLGVATEGAGSKIVVRSPITVTAIGFAVATEFLTVDLLVEV